MEEKEEQPPKPKKTRSKNYDPKLAIKGTFGQVFDAVKKNKEQAKKL